MSSLLPDLPVLVARAIDRALAYNKAHRWEDAADMLEAIRESEEVTVAAGPSIFAMTGSASTGTVVAPPRPEGFVSQPDIVPRTPSGTAAMHAPPHITANAMAVGRTLTGPVATPGRKPISVGLVATGIGAGALLATAVVVAVILVWSSSRTSEATAPIGSLPLAVASAAVIEPEKTEDEAAAAPAPPASATLEIVAKGGECTVLVDGASKGRTPVKSFEVAAGEHEVTCTSPAGVTVQKVTVQAGDTKQVSFVVSRPAAAPPPATKTSKPKPKPAKTVNPLDMR